MKVHQNYGMVQNINNAITAKGNKSKAGGNQNYVQFFTPHEPNYTIGEKDHNGDPISLPRYEIENI